MSSVASLRVLGFKNLCLINSPFGNRTVGNGDREEIYFCNQNFSYTSMGYVYIACSLFLIYKLKTWGVGHRKIRERAVGTEEICGSRVIC